jgi:hypothetical protein
LWREELPLLSPSGPVSAPNSSSARQLVLRSATRDCSAVHQGSAVHMERLQRSASRECSAMHQGSAAHMERVQCSAHEKCAVRCSAHEKCAVRCSAHRKLLRCPAKRAGDDVGKKERSAVYQGSAVHTKRVLSSAHRKLLRCIAKRAGDEEGEWRER